MKHFEDHEWVDYTRGTAPPDRRAQLQQHLDEECAECTAAFRLWSKVWSVAAAEESFEPPAGRIAGVKAMFAAQRRASTATARVLRLVADSLRQPLLAGVRSQAAVPRQLLFEEGRFHVDVRIEPAHAPGGLTLVGQVLLERAARAAGGYEGRPVSALLLVKDRVVDLAEVNALGEFQLGSSAADDLTLWIVIAGEEPLVLRLPDGNGDGQPESGGRATEPH